MADIELVIKIPEDEYKIIKNCTAPMPWIEHLIKDGAPLPKGHGALIDISNIDVIELEDSTHIIRHEKGDDVDVYISAPTILESDKGSEEKPKTDIRECGSCKYCKDGHRAGTEECHLCMWESQYKPKADTWSIKDIANALERHGIVRLEQEPTVKAIPLDKVEQIRAEIEQEYNKFRNMSDKWDERACGLGTALEIIDKALKEQIE